jgi:glycosyltransferase involved in cell wall biosynthesis
MMQRTSHLGLENAVRFTGLLPHSEIPRMLGASDVAILPYPKMAHAWWGSSMKLFEYLASGIAVIASDVGQQVTEVIRHEVNGLLVPPGNAGALAAAMKRLIGDQSLRSKLGRRAREDAVQKYSWEHYLLRLERVYEAVINRQPVNLI